jgi:hypothetical protein
MTNDTQTLTLTGFLLARIAEREALAKAATHQKVAGPSHGAWHADSAALQAGGILDRADRAHIAANDPHAVLAECEAKRQIVEKAVYHEMEHEFLLPLALAYADHPDCRQEWDL